MRKKEIYMGAGTLACALAVGLLMQTTDTAGKRYGAFDDERQFEPANTQPKNAIFTTNGLVLSDVTDTAAVADPRANATLETPVLRQPMPDKPQLASLTSPEPPQPEGCATQALSTPAQGGVVTLSLSSECHAGAHVTIRHEALVFTQALDDAGQLTLEIPALSPMARIDVSFDANTHSVIETQVDDVDDVNRVILQWRGPAGFELHAREFGALYGGRGHVWYGANARRASSEIVPGGQIVRLGSSGGANAQTTDIYTFPKNLTGNSDQIDLTIEVEVTAENCGQVIEAQALEMAGAQTLRTQRVTFSVPGCDATGDFLVLNNAFEDLKLAAR